MSTLLGTSVEAGGETISQGGETKNSQTLALLEASAISSVLPVNKIKKEESTTKDSKNTKDSKEEIGEVDEGSTVNILADNSLLPMATAATPDEDSMGEGEYNVDVYVVRKGDTVAAIADMFDVSPDTIYSANDLPKGTKLKDGDVLIILPFSGVDYTVKKGDTLKGIANKFKVSVDDIIESNGIEKNKIAVGQKLMIPGGEMQDDVKKPETNKKKGGSGSGIPVYADAPATNVNGYFIKPIPCRLTQGRHDRYAVDLGCREIGTPILAAAEGEVIFAKIGWNGAFGNLTIIRHPNGVQTFYGHQSKIIVSKGDHVEQGQVIGYVGSTGRSTGPHLHFEVRGAKNPGFDNSWKPWSNY